jgi:hypothetical protein
LLEKSNEWVGLGEQTREKINEIWNFGRNIFDCTANSEVVSVKICHLQWDTV